MKAENYEARIETSDNDIVLTTSKRILTLGVEGSDGRQLMAHLSDRDVIELTGALVNWQRLKVEGFD